MTLKRILVLLVAGVALAALSACGGSSARVAQAPAGGDKVAFCQDNSTLDKATSAAQQPSDLVAIFKDNQTVLTSFKAQAPAEITNDAGSLVTAANDAIASGDANTFNTPELLASGKRVDAYCGQNSDGSPAGTTTTLVP